MPLPRTQVPLEAPKTRRKIQSHKKGHIKRTKKEKKKNEHQS